MINCTSVRRHFSLNACANPKDCNVIPFVAPVKIKFAPHSNGKSAGDKPPFSGSDYLWIHGFDKALKLDRSPTSFVCVCLFPPPLPFKDESAGAWFSRTTESCDSIALAKFLPAVFALNFLLLSVASAVHVWTQIWTRPIFATLTYNISRRRDMSPLRP